MNIRKTNPPWASGPGEILKHGLDLIKHDSDVNRRLAMISIDNAVELMIRTYLGLPSRVTGLGISKKKMEELQESFPKLLDALEEMAKERCKGINLGDIEWYHRIRNQLYHEGNGITVEREKVEIYGELANVLFNNLFGYRIIESETESNSLLVNFMRASQEVDKALFDATSFINDRSIEDYSESDVVALFFNNKVISSKDFIDYENLMQIRNDIIHNNINYNEVLNKEFVSKVNSLSLRIYDWIGIFLKMVTNKNNEIVF